MGKDPSEIRDEIEATRARLGDTVEALSYKADVPARTKERIDGVKSTIGDAVESAKGTAADATTRIGNALRASTASSLSVAADRMSAVAERMRDPGNLRTSGEGDAARPVLSAAPHPLWLALGAIGLALLIKLMRR